MKEEFNKEEKIKAKQAADSIIRKAQLETERAETQKKLAKKRVENLISDVLSETEKKERELKAKLWNIIENYSEPQTIEHVLQNEAIESIRKGLKFLRESLATRPEMKKELIKDLNGLIVNLQRNLKKYASDKETPAKINEEIMDRIQRNINEAKEMLKLLMSI